MSSQDREKEFFAGKLFLSPGISEDTPIYRFVPWKYLEYLLVNQRLTMVRPERWQDPFELINVPVQIRVSDATGATISQVMEGSDLQVFSQCWTTVNMGDTMLRAYSDLSGEPDNSVVFDPSLHKNEAVQISTTVGKLRDALAFGLRNLPSFQRLYISKVRYLSEDDIADEISGTYAHGPDTGKDPDCVASLLSKKRIAYQAEQEVRPMVFMDSSARNLDLLTLEFNSKLSLDSVVIDPRLTGGRTDHGANAYSNREALLKSWGYAGKIEHSDLYSYGPIYDAVLDLDAPDCKISDVSKARWRDFLEKRR